MKNFSMQYWFGAFVGAALMAIPHVTPFATFAGLGIGLLLNLGLSIWLEPGK